MTNSFMWRKLSACARRRESRRHVVLALVLVLFAAPSFAQVKSYKDIKAPALRKLNMPQPKRIQLANGMVILMMDDHELPLIRGAGAQFRRGAVGARGRRPEGQDRDGRGDRSRGESDHGLPSMLRRSATPTHPMVPCAA